MLSDLNDECEGSKSIFNIIWFFSTFALKNLKISLFIFYQVTAQKYLFMYFHPVDFTILLQLWQIMETYFKTFLERPALFLKMSFIFSQVLLTGSMGLRRAWKLHTLQ